MRPPRKSSDRGYTLLEVLVALVILSLATVGISLVAPRWTSSSTARTMLSTTKSALAQARDLALTERRIVVVTVAGGTLRVNDDQVVAAPDQVNLRLDTTNGSIQEKIAFFPDGSSTGGSITIEGNGRTDAVTLSRLTGTLK